MPDARRPRPAARPLAARPLAARPLAALALAAIGLSCGDQRPLPTAPAPASAVTVDATPADVVLMVREPGAGDAAGGTSAPLTLVVRNPQGHALPHKHEKHQGWQSLAPGVVRVDSLGVATAVDTGLARVVATHKYATDTVIVRVVPVPTASIALAPGAVELFAGDTTTVLATALDSAGVALPGRPVAWRTGDAAIATADTGIADGAGERATVVGGAVGQTTLHASVANAPESGMPDAAASATVTVRPQPVRRVVIAPESPVMTVDGTLLLAATAYDRFGNELADRAIAWSSLDPALATVSAAGLVTSLDPGSAAIVAASEGVADTAFVQMRLPEEARALWVNRFEFTTEASIVTIFNRAKQGNLNIVYFQVRGQGDAYYRSDLEPCAIALCGSLGNGYPGWDPLAVAVREGKKHGIQVHAWVNAFPAWASPTTNNAAYCALLRESRAGFPRHMSLANPGWAMQSTARVAMTCQNSTAYEYAYVSPGIPEVRTHLARVAADIARRYEVDGIHLDRVRYPGNFHSSDPASVAEFVRLYGRNPGSPSTDMQWAAFRQSRVSLAVAELADSVRAARPAAVISAAVWPIYDARKWGWSSSNGLMQYMQDPRAWGAQGSLDVQVPMTYFNVNATYCSYTLNNPDWACLLDDHLQGFDAATGRHTYIGIGANRDTANTFQQVRLGRQRGVKGFAFYSYNEMTSRNRFALLGAGLFRRPATVPAMSWRAGGVTQFAARAALATKPRRGSGIRLFPGARRSSVLEGADAPPSKEFEEEPSVPPDWQ